MGEPSNVGVRASEIALDERVNLLVHVRALSRLPRPVLHQLAGAMQEETYPAGAAVVREGEQGDRLYVVAHGVADVTADTSGGPTHLTTVSAGDLFGELALLPARSSWGRDSGRRHATVTARTPVVLLSLTGDAFEALLDRYPEALRIFESGRRTMLLSKFFHVHVLYRLNFKSARRERMFLASLSFFVTFAGVRAVVIMIRSGRGPFRDVSAGGRHIHHLVWGILVLLLVGYAWLLQIGTGVAESRKLMRETAILYGIGSALTLDEFALWLNLEDVYWLPEGRLSIDAVILFGSLLSIGLWGRPFWRALFRLVVGRRTEAPGV